MDMSALGRKFPLMESNLIGLRAPPGPRSSIFCSERILDYLRVLESQCPIRDIEFQGCENIWSSTFCSQYSTLVSEQEENGDPADERKDSVDTDYSTGSWDRSQLSLSSTSALSRAFLSSEDEFSASSLSTPIQSPDKEVPEKSKYFVIKSYSALDVETSRKKKIWASTDLGNKRLDKAYRESNGSVFLFFSVNGSSQFCGVARMMGSVDFSKSSNAWVEASRWKGVFPVSWLIHRDIGNKAFRRLRVAANENKPVSNSRDTQELPSNIGLAMLDIFSATDSGACANSVAAQYQPMIFRLNSRHDT